tara:strand:+ start:178 stop:510 length:333 start_codon:yes stop_codon:yes gene_type:complete
MIMGRKRRERRMDEQGYYKGTDNTEARMHGLDVPPVEPAPPKKESRWNYKISKTEAKTQKSYATAAKRNSLANLIKWVLIALGVFYGITKLGGINVGDGLLDQVKGFFGQ